MTESNTIRIARNTMYMYVRMAVVLVVKLYISRITLQTLGVNDYGVYNVVGSVIGIMSMLRGLFTSSTQRFLNHEMGKGDFDRLRQVFNISLQINTFVSLFFVVAVEAIGMWFLSAKLNASPDRVSAAYWVLHFSALSAVVSIYSSVFDAVVIAHEKMNFFALNSVLHVFVLYAEVIYLKSFEGDRLILYAFFVLLAETIYALLCFFYCRFHFLEFRLRRTNNKILLREMMSFAGWQVFGNGAWTMAHNGTNMLLNVYCGPAVNAARGVAYQVQVAVGQLVNNVSIAVSPYSVKKYASGDNNRMFRMFEFSSKVFFMIGLMVSVPLMYNASLVLDFWLGCVPNYSVRFVQIILVWSILRCLHSPFDTMFKAVGKLKWYQVCEGGLLSLPFLFVWLILRNGGSVYWAFSMIVAFEAVNLVFISIIAQHEASLHLRCYVRTILLPAVSLMGILLVGLWVLIHWNLESSAFSLFFAFGMDVLFLFYGWFGLFNADERSAVQSLFKR